MHVLGRLARRHVLRSVVLGHLRIVSRRGHGRLWLATIGVNLLHRVHHDGRAARVVSRRITRVMILFWGIVGLW